MVLYWTTSEFYCLIMAAAIPPSCQPTSPEGPTGKLCQWIHDISLRNVPAKIQTRAKYLILDGIACALIGAKLPTSKKAADAIFDMESPGDCTIIGWEKVIYSNFLQILIYTHL